MIPKFDEVCNSLSDNGTVTLISSRGTEYSVICRVLSKGKYEGELAIIASPKSGSVYIHADCWGENITCQRQRAGGVYNGKYSIYDWYRDNKRLAG